MADDKKDKDKPPEQRTVYASLDGPSQGVERPGPPAPPLPKPLDIAAPSKPPPRGPMPSAPPSGNLWWQKYVYSQPEEPPKPPAGDAAIPRPDLAMDNMRRSFEAGSPSRIERGGQSSEKTVPTPAPETANPMHPRDRHLYVQLGVSVAILIGVGLVGLGAVFNGWPHVGSALFTCGIIGAYIVALRLVERKPVALPSRYSMAYLGIVAIATWFFVGWQMWLWFHTPMQGYTQAQLDKVVAAAKTNSGFTQQQVDEKVAEALKAQNVAVPAPKSRVYPDKADAKETLENLHDLLVKKFQPALAIFPKSDVFRLQHSLQQAVQARLDSARRPGATEKPDLKQVTTEAIKGFLNDQLSAITDENTKLGDAIGSISGIRTKQKAITMGSTEEFFALAYPPQAFTDAQNDLAKSLRYFLRKDTLETDVSNAMDANYVLFENARGLYDRQIGDAIHRIAEEISAIETK